MSDQDRPGDERTEQPTARRRDRAREEGQVAQSRDLTSAAVFITGTVLLGAAVGPGLGEFAIRMFRESVRSIGAGAADGGLALAGVQGAALGTIGALMPLAIGLMATAAFAGAMQTGGLISMTPLTPKLSHVNPAAGLKRLVSPDALVTLLKSLAKLAVLGIITAGVLMGSKEQLLALGAAAPAGIAFVLRSLIERLALITGLAMLAIAVGDYAYHRFQHEKQMRMSRQEIVREHRETEGDPMIKSRMVSLARARARLRMLQQVPTADVVVVNPTHVAVALRYDLDVHSAPVVVAMGERKLAERIKALARKHNVPVVENQPVARALLATATVGKPIPSALYTAIAEILAFVYRQRGLLPAAARRTERLAEGTRERNAGDDEGAREGAREPKVERLP